MTKEENRSNLNSCWNKAAPTEEMFILLDRDPVFSGTIRDWVQRRIEGGHNHPSDPQITSALALAEKFEGNPIEIGTRYSQ